MPTDDDLTVSAYVDGELGEQDRRAFEARLFTDPALMAHVRTLREQDRLLGQAFSLTPRKARSGARSSRPQRLASLLRMTASIAATLVAGIGIGLISAGRLSTPAAVDAGSVRSSTLQHTLESIGSGMHAAWHDPASGHSGRIVPISTYRNRAGAFCREFEERRQIDDTEMTEGGIACRDSQGLWRVRVRYYL